MNDKLQNEAIKLAFETYLHGTSIAEQVEHTYQQANDLVRKDESERFRLKIGR